jgi:hypothetical protein
MPQGECQACKMSPFDDRDVGNHEAPSSTHDARLGRGETSRDLWTGSGDHEINGFPRCSPTGPHRPAIRLEPDLDFFPVSPCSNHARLVRGCGECRIASPASPATGNNNLCPSCTRSATVSPVSVRAACLVLRVTSVALFSVCLHTGRAPRGAYSPLVLKTRSVVRWRLARTDRPAVHRHRRRAFG